MNPISINRDGQQFGPFSPQDIPAMIAAGQLVATDLAWHSALPEWQPLATLPEFAHLFQPAATAPPQSNATTRYLASREKVRAKQRRAEPQSPDGKPRSKAKVLLFVLATVLVFVILIGYAAVTTVVGSAVATAIKDNAASEESFSTDFEYKLVSYDRGFLKSTAELGIISPVSPPDDPGIPVNLEIYHGPLLTGPGGTKPGLHRIIAKADRSQLPADTSLQFAEDEILQIVFEADLSGNIHIEGFVSGFSSEPATDELEPGLLPGSVTFSGATGSLDSNSDFTFVTANVEWGELTTTDSDSGSKFHSAPITLEIDVPEIVDGHIVNGSMTFTAEHITVENPGTLLKMSNFQLESVTATRSGKLRNDFSFKLDNLTYSGEGAPINIDGRANLSFGIRGIDTAALTRIRAASANMQDEVLAEVEVENAPASEISSAMADMLQPGLGVSADLGIGSVGGDITLNLDLAFEGDRPGRELETLGEAIHAIEATGRFRLSKSFLADDSMDEMITTWREEGIVADLGDKYSVTLSMRNGEPRLNGEVMDLPEFIQESIDEPIPWDLLTSPSDTDFDEPILLDGPGDIGSPMPAGAPVDSDPSMAPGESPDSDGVPDPTTEAVTEDPDDPGIPYDPTASDEENMARQKARETQSEPEMEPGDE